MCHQMQARFPRVAVIAAIAFFYAGMIPAEERTTRNAASEMRRLLPWFPEDTETLLAAQSYVLPRSSVDAFSDKWNVLIPQLVLGEFHQYLGELVDRKILLAFKGERRSQFVGSMGDFYAEGCTVVIFERDLGDAGVEWTTNLRTTANEIRKIAGREVYCFTPDSKARAYKHPLLYFLRLSPDTILCATHDEYLRQLLNRIDKTPRGRAFPDNLPQWATIDRSARVWMIRKIPASQQKPIEGLTFTWSHNQTRVVYLPRGSSAERVFDRVRRLWEFRIETGNPDLDRANAPTIAALRKALHFELDKQGRATVTFKNEGQDEGVRFFLFLQLFHSQIEDGDVGPP